MKSLFCTPLFHKILVHQLLPLLWWNMMGLTFTPRTQLPFSMSDLWVSCWWISLWCTQLLSYTLVSAPHKVCHSLQTRSTGTTLQQARPLFCLCKRTNSWCNDMQSSKRHEMLTFSVSFLACLESVCHHTPRILWRLPPCYRMHMCASTKL